MARVKEVVGYAVANDMYIIINTHHDNSIFKLLDNEMAQTKIALTNIWKQIALTFRDYNEKLIFEGLNEPRTMGTPNEWNGGTKEERDNLNVLNQLFVDVVRASGGNNLKRILMIPTYAASVSDNAVNDLKIPTDNANTKNKIVVSVHSYAPYNFALNLGEGSVKIWDKTNTNDRSQIEYGLDIVYDSFVSKGIPVIMGEMGALNKDNLAYRVEWTKYYISYARSKNIPCFWWDNGRMGISHSQDDGETFGIIDRRNNAFPYPEIIDALIH